MKDNIKAVLSENSFFAALAVCLLITGIGGYFLLFDHAPKQAVETSLPEHIVTDSEVTMPELELPDDPEFQEVLQPVQVMAAPKPAPVPEEPLDPAPVIAEPPRVVVSPLQGDVLTAFAVDQLVYDTTMRDWRTHDGIDIAARVGTAVVAACAGQVLQVTDDDRMGITVVLAHPDGRQTTYANLQADPPVAIGDDVAAGQIIGAVGTSAAAESGEAPHLHFAVQQDGDAVDPHAFLGD